MYIYTYIYMHTYVRLDKYFGCWRYLRSGPTPRMSGKNDLFEKYIYSLHTRHHHTLCADEYDLCTQGTIILSLTFGESMTVREG